MSYLSKVLGASPSMTEIPQRSWLEHAVSKPIPLITPTATPTDSLLHSFLKQSSVRQSAFDNAPIREAFKPEARAHLADVPPWTPPKVVKLQEPPSPNLWRSYKNAFTKGGPLVWEDIQLAFSSFMRDASHQGVWSTRIDQLLQKLPGVGPHPSTKTEATLHPLHTSHIDQE